MLTPELGGMALALSIGLAQFLGSAAVVGFRWNNNNVSSETKDCLFGASYDEGGDTTLGYR